MEKPPVHRAAGKIGKTRNREIGFSIYFNILHTRCHAPSRNRFSSSAWLHLALHPFRLA
jgi:hypothetical protein